MGYNRPDLQRDYDATYYTVLYSHAFCVTTDLIYKGIMTLFFPLLYSNNQFISYNRPDLQRDYDFLPSLSHFIHPLQMLQQT